MIEHVGNDYTEQPRPPRTWNEKCMIIKSATESLRRIPSSRRASVPIPHGRGKPRDLQIGEIMNKVLNAKTEFSERGKVRKASRIELTIRRLAASATKGDVASAPLHLKMRAHAEKYGDSGPMIIRIVGGPPNAFR